MYTSCQWKSCLSSLTGKTGFWGLNIIKARLGPHKLHKWTSSIGLYAIPPPHVSLNQTGDRKVGTHGIGFHPIQQMAGGCDRATCKTKLKRQLLHSEIDCC
ncbi:hypothetical protein BDE02_03G150800 [Populus trichocarpa]|jgi:hypothetical protein|nr:hypothetical protein BDE02_03G150800 [Populus trichocarpa]